MHIYTDFCIFDILVVSSTNDIFVLFARGQCCYRTCPWHCDMTMKKALGEMQYCSLAVVRRSQKFSPRRRPPSRGAGRPKFNQLETVTIYLHVKIDACNFELTNPHTNTRRPPTRQLQTHITYK